MSPLHVRVNRNGANRSNASLQKIGQNVYDDPATWPVRGITRSSCPIDQSMVRFSTSDNCYVRPAGRIVVLPASCRLVFALNRTKRPRCGVNRSGKRNGAKRIMRSAPEPSLFGSFRGHLPVFVLRFRQRKERGACSRLNNRALAVD